MSGVEEIRKQLIGEELTGVTFVCDYIQLQFSPPPTFNIYSACEVSVDGRSCRFGEESFANMLISCLNTEVAEIEDDPTKKQVQIQLKGGSRITIPYREGTFDEPEAAEFVGRDEVWVIWP
jgi:hypothetical protein